MDTRKLLKGLIWTGLIVGATWGAARFLLIKTWKIPDDDPVLSTSIMPSLAPGDTVVLLHRGTPGFGDLVRCTDPDEPRRWIIGRIAGEGGDTVEIKASRLVVNGQNVDVEYACKKAKIQVPHPGTGAPVDLRCDMEALGASTHKRAHGGSTVRAPIKRTVQPGFYFLVSDNRAFPNDSTTFGAVPVETCDARIIFRMWSADGFGDADTRMTWID